jgi:hypothetical protein
MNRRTELPVPTGTADLILSHLSPGFLGLCTGKPVSDPLSSLPLIIHDHGKYLSPSALVQPFPSYSTCA